MFSPSQSQLQPKQNPIPQTCAVSKPEHQGFGRNKHTTYLIKATFGETQKSLVRRRFTDFAWLQQRLVVERSGIIVPVLPPAPKAEKFSEEFVQQRQAKLDRFLLRIIDHDDLVTSACLWTFLTANPKEWAAAKKERIDANKLTRQSSAQSDESAGDADADNITIDVASATGGMTSSTSMAASGSGSTPKKKGWGQWMKETRTKFAISRGKLQLEETPAQAKTFGDLETYSTHLETCIRILHQDCQGYLEAQNESAAKLQTMAAAFAEMWGEHALQNTSTSNMYQTLGETWAASSKEVMDRADELRVSFQDPLEELTFEVVALKEALDNRKKCVRDYTKLYHHNQWLVREMDKLKRPGMVLSGAKEDAFFQLEADITASDAEVKLARDQVNMVSDRLEKDVPRFRKDFHQRMQNLLHHFHQTQAQFLTETHAPTLMSILPHLQVSLADAPSQPQLAVEKQASTLQLSYSSTGAHVTINDPNAPQQQAAPSLVPLAPAPSAAPPPPTLHAVPEPVMNADDGVDVSFGAMSMLGEATAPPPGAAPPPVPPPTES